MEDWEKKYEKIWTGECPNIGNKKKFKKVLLMPVGTGFGIEERIQSLAHGLQFLITEINPNLVVFFGNERSIKTIQSIKKQYINENFIKNGKNGNVQFKQCLFIPLNNVDDFDECFNKFSQAIDLFENSEVIIDYTSGTRTMTIAAGIAGTLYDKELRFVGGERGIHHIVEKGNEVNLNPVLDKVNDKEKFNDALDYFNNHHIQSAKNSLENIKLECDENSTTLTKENYFKIELLKHLMDAYNYWDSFNHKEAFNSFKDFQRTLNDFQDWDSEKRVINFFNNKLQFKKFPNYVAWEHNLDALAIINNPNSKKKYLYILASLINNAQGKYEQKYYDDAIARLYRATELIAQIKLFELGVDHLNLLPEQVEKIKTKYPLLNFDKSEEGVVKFNGLGNTFKVLRIYEPQNSINGKSLIKYYDESKIKDLIDHRTSSILAHGLSNKNKNDFIDFYNSVVDFAKLLDEDMGFYLTDTSFPKFI